ncbi:Hemicentin-2 [Stylophora pistillata]|uniref:Hemicentin-2 n=1 Tax=Stylophora pistillata TaxID=50429 RepID=A0A2B4R010_STYPI|nr:Hemicentin-2 [Stylophora pistillata]
MAFSGGGERPFGVIEPFPESIYPLEYTSASVTCIAFDASGKLQPDRIEFHRRDDLNRYRKLEGDRFVFNHRTDNIRGNIKLYTTMTLKNVTIQDDSQYGDLGSYECHAFAKNVSSPKRHGFSVSVITRAEIPTVKVTDSSTLNPGDDITIFCNLTDRGNENSTPLKRISWFKDGKLLRSVRNPDPDVKQDFIAPIHLTSFNVRQAGIYTCLLEVKLRHIKEYSVRGDTFLKIAPWLPKPKEDIEEKASKGSDVSFECAAQGFPLEVEWKVKKKNKDTVQACIKTVREMICSGLNEFV